MEAAGNSDWRYPSAGDEGTQLLTKHAFTGVVLLGKGLDLGCCRETAKACLALGLLSLATWTPVTLPREI